MQLITFIYLTALVNPSSLGRFGAMHLAVLHAIRWAFKTILLLIRSAFETVLQILPIFEAFQPVLLLLASPDESPTSQGHVIT